MKWKKIWRFIWKDDSWSSWLVNVILAIVVVKFVIYPGLGWLLGTSYPVVAVVSCSMQHEATNCWPDCYMKSSGNLEDLKNCFSKEKSLCGVKGKNITNYWQTCGNWYEEKNINKEQFKKFQQNKGFNIGDIFVLKKPDNIKLGDVIVYNNGINNEPIIHRVIGIDEEEGKKYYKTKGDFNEKSYGFEQKIYEERVYGKVVVKLPYLGWVKIIFNMLLKMAGIL